jgi:hypothetical protein
METQDPRRYLETDARIIAENETHVALALRVEKAKIARYLPLMAALADLAPGIKALISRHTL